MKACGISLSADGAVSQEPEGDAADLGEFLSESPTYLADAESQAAAAASAANLDGRWSALADASAARLPFLERMVRWVEDNGANSSGLAESWPDLDRDGQEYNAANSRWRVECQALQDRLTADQPR